MHDTGINVNTSVLTDQTTREVEDEILALAELEEFVRHRGHVFVRLERPLITRVHLPRPSGEIVRAFCVSEDIGCSGIRVLLPARLDLKPGMPLDLDLFVSEDDNPVPVRGVVSKIAHTCGEDVARYVIEIRFGPLKGDTLQRIAEYVQAQSQAQAQLPA